MVEMQSKKEKNFGVVLGSVVGALLLIVIIVTLFALNSEAVTPAYLNVEDGTVEVNTGSGWQTATDGMELGLDDKVRTGEGTASVILYESAIISLDPNTEISIAELDSRNSKIEQTSGSTWNKFTKLNGMEGLEVDTPNSVATVRGTEFEVSVEEGVAVIEGEVETTDKVSGKVLSVPAGQKAARLAGKLALENLSDAERSRLERKVAQNERRIAHLMEKQENKRTKLQKMLEKKAEKGKGKDKGADGEEDGTISSAPVKKNAEKKNAKDNKGKKNAARDDTPVPEDAPEEDADDGSEIEVQVTDSEEIIVETADDSETGAEEDNSDEDASEEDSTAEEVQDNPGKPKKK